ncbi:MAG: UDP-3-O-(3-hydroxymyristoyl)glucosamine N-acyltransferase [Gemmatimonadetes bacterium]|nr:UDP-3-O-(3-hydroxymyristoyl)glucosamine N-acyltransferase [Gemmatimonadota bacterium]
MHTTGRLTVGEIADLVGGELVGDDQTTIAGVAPLDGAGPGDLSFLVTARYLEAFRDSAAGAVLLPPRFRDEAAGPGTRIVVDSPYLALARVLPRLDTTPAVPWGIHPTASVGPRSRWSGRIAVGAWAAIGRDVVLGADCIIGPHVTIGDGVRLGERCRLDAHASVEGGARLGHRVVLCAGARVGTPGFGYAEGESGHEGIRHVGGCLVGDDVEIGANTTVDRGGIADTVIGSGTKIDNLVQVAHNVQVGKRCLIMAQVGLAGSTVVEDDVMLAGQAGLAGHLTVGRGARVAAQSGVIGDVPPSAVVSGYPARSHREVLRQVAVLKRLTPLVKRLEQLAARDAGTT